MQNTSSQTGTGNINLQGVTGSQVDIDIQNYNFGKYDTYQEMQAQLEEYREILEDLPKSKAEKRDKYQQKINEQIKKIEPLQRKGAYEKLVSLQMADN